LCENHVCASRDHRDIDTTIKGSVGLENGGNKQKVPLSPAVQPPFFPSQKDEDSDSEDEVFPEEDDVIISDDEAEEPVLPDAVLIGWKRRLYEPDDVKRAFKELNSRVMRRIVVQENRRSDGRSTTVRPFEV
jgi:hypothetical protein